MKAIIAKESDPLEAVIAVFLFGLCFLLYAFSLKAEFVLDAYYVITQNPLIKHPELWIKIFTRGFFDAYKAYSGLVLNYYRPVTTLSFAVDYKLWGLNPFGYGLVNVFIHFLNSFFVYRLSGLVLKKKESAFLSAVLFAVLPTHEWVVNYTVGRGDLLEAFFCLASLISLALFLEHRNFRKFFLSIVLFILALLSRETAVVLPLLAGLVVFALSGNVRKTLGIFAVFSSVVVFYYFFRSWLLPVVTEPWTEVFSPHNLFASLATAFQYIFRYFICWSVLSSLPPFFKGPVLSAVLAAAALGGVMIYAGTRTGSGSKKEVSLGILWLVIGLLPLVITRGMTANLGPYLSEHFLYLSSVGFVVALAGFLLGLPKNTPKWITTFIAGFYISVTVFNNTQWTTEKALLNRVREKEKPQAYVAAKQMALRYEESEEALKGMIQGEKNPVAQSPLLKRLGTMARLKKDYPQAVDFLRQAIEQNPRNLEAYVELGLTYLEEDQPQKAAECLTKALAMDSELIGARQILGVVLYHQGNFKEAIGQLRQALYYSPESVVPRLLLALSYFFTKDEKAYQDVIQTVEKQRVPMLFVFKFLATEFYRHGYLKNAQVLLEKADELYGKDADVLALLGWVYFQSNEKQKASSCWQQAIRLDSGNAFAQEGVKKMNAESSQTGRP